MSRAIESIQDETRSVTQLVNGWEPNLLEADVLIQRCLKLTQRHE
jgi:hypothetical protein